MWTGYASPFLLVGWTVGVLMTRNKRSRLRYALHHTNPISYIPLYSLISRITPSKVVKRGTTKRQCGFANTAHCASPTAKCGGSKWTFKRGDDYLFPCGRSKGRNDDYPTVECGSVLGDDWKDGTQIQASCASGFGCEGVEGGVCR